MQTVERESFLAYSTLPYFKKKISKAKEIIQEALAIAPAYVACSWGKDSLVMAHLVWSIAPETPIIHVGGYYQELLNDYEKVESDFSKRFPCNYTKIEPSGKPSWVVFKESIDLPMAFVGLRAEESKHRRLSIAKRGLIYQYKRGTYRACPLGYWVWQDVWAYIVSQNLPYLSSYDHFAEGGKDMSRTSAITTRRGEEFGRFEQLKRRCPEYYSLLHEVICA